jgi:hypothetical protein
LYLLPERTEEAVLDLREQVPKEVLSRIPATTNTWLSEQCSPSSEGVFLKKAKERVVEVLHRHGLKRCSRWQCKLLPQEVSKVTSGCYSCW